MWINAWPLHTYYAAYVDLRKSLPHILPNGQLENPKGLAFWIPEQRYLANIEDYMDQISKLKLNEFIINDPRSEKELLKFYVEKGKQAIFDGNLGNGMINLQYTKELMAYRKRENGILGIESITGFDTRLGIAEYLKNPKKFPEYIRRTNNEEANFSNFGKIKEEKK